MEERTLKLKHSEIELITKALDSKYHNILSIIRDNPNDLDYETIMAIKLNATKYFELCTSILDSEKDV